MTTRKVILISFLNAILGLEGKRRIEDVEILNPYQLPIMQGLKSSIVDVKAHDGNGHSYIIEMQVAEPYALEKRLLYYLSKDEAPRNTQEPKEQIDSGEKYAELKPVIFIGIFDFTFTASDTCISHHAVCNVESGERVIKDMDFFFLELPKFTKTQPQLDTITDKWLFFIKEARNLEVMPENLGDEGLAQAYHDAAKFTWTKEELSAYESVAIREQDERGIRALAIRRAEEQARAEGKAEGKEEGKAEGKAEEAAAKELAFVMRLHHLGKSENEIIELTGLSTERVREILVDIQSNRT